MRIGISTYQRLQMKRWIALVKCITLVLILLLVASCGQQPKLPEVPGIKGPYFNVLNGKVIVTLKLLKANLNYGGKVPIPKTLESHFEVSPNVLDGGTLVVFHLDAEDLKSVDIGIGDPNTLPDGRAVPGVPGGVLNDSLRVDTELLDLSFYYHQKLFGFYLPLGWDTRGFGGYWNVVINQQNIGMMGAVASDQDGRGAGLLLFLRLDAIKKRELQKLIEHSKKNKDILY
jgi:hypothetical protein